MSRIYVLRVFLTRLTVASCVRTRVGFTMSAEDGPHMIYKGLKWHAKVFPDDWCTHPDHADESKKDCAGSVLRSRRIRQPTLLKKDLFDMTQASLGDAILLGPINGWQGIRQVQLQSITCQSESSGRGHYLWRINNRSNLSGAFFATGIQTAMALALGVCKSQVLWASLVAADWTRTGWTRGSPGFAFWFFAQDSNPRVIVGEDMIAEAGEARAVRVHTFAHRQPPRFFSTIFQKILHRVEWHSGVVIEWDHAKYVTIAEVNWRNRGRGLWYDDMSSIRRHAPVGYDIPFTSSFSEISLFDIPARNVHEVQDFLNKYSGKGDGPDVMMSPFRFHRPDVIASDGNTADVKLFRNRQSDIARYVLNYTRTDGSYDLVKRNCATFTADFYTFLTQKTMKIRAWPVGLVYTNKAKQFLKESRP